MLALGTGTKISAVTLPPFSAGLLLLTTHTDSSACLPSCHITWSIKQCGRVTTPPNSTAFGVNSADGGVSCDADLLDPQPGSTLSALSEGTSVIDLHTLTADLDTAGEPPCLLAPNASQATECRRDSQCASLASHWLELHGQVSCRHPCKPLPSRLSVPLTAVSPQQQPCLGLRHHNQTRERKQTSGAAMTFSNRTAKPHACTASVAHASCAAPSLRFAELFVTNSAGTRDGEQDNGQLTHSGVTSLGGSANQHAGIPPLLYPGHSAPPTSMDGDGDDLAAEVVKAAENDRQHQKHVWAHRVGLLLWLAAVTAVKNVARELVRTRLCV